MGCFHPEKSDIDLIVVVSENLSDDQKGLLMQNIVLLNEEAPAKGLEISVVKKEFCKPFVYPTPFELHFSRDHLQRYLNNPADYIEKMHGVDKDLAAHFTVINHYGIVLWGEKIEDVFSEVPKQDYADSIYCDIEKCTEGYSERSCLYCPESVQSSGFFNRLFLSVQKRTADMGNDPSAAGIPAGDFGCRKQLYRKP